MKISRVVVLFFILSGLFQSCIRPIDVEVKENDNLYVVEGLITNEPGPYEVHITRSATYSASSDGTNFPVDGAMVTLFDDAGNADLLLEVGNGYYITRNMQGIPGRSYYINIKTIEGDEIESIPEAMPFPVEVDSFYYQFADETILNKAGHKVFFLLDDPSDQQNYFRWRWEGTYQFFTQFDGPPGASVCWRYEYDYEYINVTSDQYVNGNVFEQEIYKVPFFDVGKYLLTVWQYGLTQPAYKFWSLIDEQINQTGGVFDPPPSKIQGNLYMVNSPEQRVLGYFGASPVQKIPVLIDRRDTPYRSGLYLRSYPRNTFCFTLVDSEEFVYDPDTWPEGWEE